MKKIYHKVAELVGEYPELRNNKQKFLNCYFTRHTGRWIPFHAMDNIESVLRSLRELNIINRLK